MAYLTSLLRQANNPFGVAAVDGNVYGAHFGTVTTPLATPATTAITAARPQVWIRVPDSTVIVPISVKVVVESAGATTQGEISIATTTNDVGNGTSSAGTSGPLNMRTDSAKTSLCTARQLATGDVTTETGLLELERFSFAAGAVNQMFTAELATDRDFTVLTGAASLLVYIGGNAVNFYATIKWLELPEAFAN